jgi:hypothetical protein
MVLPESGHSLAVRQLRLGVGSSRSMTSRECPDRAIEWTACLSGPAAPWFASVGYAKALASVTLEAVAVPAVARALLPAMMAPMGIGRVDPHGCQQSNGNGEDAHQEVFLGEGSWVLETASQRQPHGGWLDRVKMPVGNTIAGLAR